MKLYAEIVLSGKEFNPEEVMKKTGCIFTSYIKAKDGNSQSNSKEIESFAVLESQKNDATGYEIKKLIKKYKKIKTAYGAKIEKSSFKLYAEVLQGGFEIKAKILKDIALLFPKIEIQLVQEEPEDD